MTRSGFCSRCPRAGDDLRGPTHTRCRLEGCRCEGHVQDTRDAAAALVAPPLRPDPELIDNAEGNKRILASDKAAAQAHLDALPFEPRWWASPLAGIPSAPEHANWVQATSLADDDARGLDGMPLSTAVEFLSRSSSRLTAAAISLDATPEDTLRLLHMLRSALSQIRDVEATLVQHVYLHGEHGDVQIEGLPVAKVTRARDRKAWEHRPLAQAVLDAHLTERGFEQPDPWEAIAWVLDAAGVAYWNCETTPGKPQVQFIE
jgi:hypothetical protein